MKVLVLKTSPRENESVSNMIVDKIVERLSGVNALDEVRVEDLTHVPFVDKSQTAQEFSDVSEVFISNVEWADVVVIGLPVYNFGVPAILKAWFDQIARAGRTFEYTETGPRGLLENKKVYIAFSSGGTEVAGGYDFATPWLKFALQFVGISDISVVSADRLAVDYDASIEKMHRELEALFAGE